MIVIGIISSPDESTNNNLNNIPRDTAKVNSESSLFNGPKQQKELTAIIDEYNSLFKEARNELQQSALREKRRDDIALAIGSYTANSWIGTINKLETNSEGKAILSIRISPNIEIKTWNNAFSDSNSGTLISKETPVYSSLFNLSKGQKVEFSGAFFPSQQD